MRKPILNEAERQAMRRAGSINAELMDYLRPRIQAGVTPVQIDQLAFDWTRQRGCMPAALGYQGFPKSTCINVNDGVCNGVPNSVPFKDGDLVKVHTVTMSYGPGAEDRWHAAQTETVLVGDVSDDARQLVQCALECFWLGLQAAKAGSPVTSIGQAIQSHAQGHGYSPVRDYMGHGIGREYHQVPAVPNVPAPQFNRFILKPGMTFTIQPMINLGTHNCLLDQRDGWTVRTADGRPSAQFEHTVLMTEAGPEVLTGTQNGPQEGHTF